MERSLSTVLTSKEVCEADINTSNDFSELLYARGFLLSPDPHRIPVEHWRQVRIGSYSISYDPRSSFAFARSENKWVAILGRAICLDTWTHDLECIAENLLTARIINREAMLDRIDMLSGRFAIIDGDETEAYVQSDAAGMRGIFYGCRDGKTFIASHANLVADQVGRRFSIFPDPQALREETNAYAIPGRLTPFEKIYCLTPNTEIEAASATVQRIFPKEPADTRSSTDVVDEVLPLLQRQFTYLAEHASIIISLTAGMDSRTTLALSKPISKKAEYFTYGSLPRTGPPYTGRSLDVATAKEMAEALQLRHHIIPVLYRIPPEPLSNIIKQNSPRISFPGSPASHLHYQSCKGLHIRSNLYEIGRAFYRAKARRPKHLDALYMSYLLTGKKCTNASLTNAFSDFMECTDFLSAQKHYDPLDLFYWEHRCGTWFNSHITEGDIVYDTFIPINSRHILKALLSVPIDERIKGYVYLEIIRRAWPETLDFPINGKRVH